MHFFFHIMVSLKLGCGFKSMASHNCCRLDQVAWWSWPGWSWSLFPVARLDNSTLCVFHHKQLKDHLREGHESWSLPENLCWHLLRRGRKHQGQTCRIEVSVLEKNPGDHREVSQEMCVIKAFNGVEDSVEWKIMDEGDSEWESHLDEVDVDREELLGVP